MTHGHFIQNLATQEFRLNYTGEVFEATVGVYGAYEYQKGWFRRPDNFGRNDRSKSHQEIWNAAGFGEGTYEFLPSWKFVVGGRVDHTRESGSNYFERNGTSTTNFDYAIDDTVFLPKAGIIKEFGENHTVGFVVQRAFRSGGASAKLSDGEVFSFDPETAWNYELSYKGRLFDDRLKIASNLFYLDIRDQQVEVLENPLDPLTAYTTNAGKSRAYGMEFEAQAQATPELSAFVSVGYVNTKFIDFDSDTLGDLSGRSSFPKRLRSASPAASSTSTSPGSSPASTPSTPTTS